MMNKCECYYEGVKPEPRYSQYTGGYVGSVDVKYGYCNGTKEQDECSCGGDCAKCDFYPEVRERSTKKEKTKISEELFKNNNLYIDKDGTIGLKSIDGISIKITNKGLIYRDRYGNEIHINDGNAWFESSSPSYEELYEYWINTKTK